MRRTLPAILGFAALVLSPQVACTGDRDPDPALAERMRASVEGTWEYTDGATTIRFRVEQSSREFHPDDPYASLSLFGEAYACGNHALVKPAGACVDVYHMPLDVEVVAGPALEMPRGTLTSSGGDSQLWFKLGATELRGVLANDVVTLQQQSGSKFLRRIENAPAG